MNGYLDLSDEQHYRDWLSRSAEACQAWLAGPARVEAAGAQNMVKVYLVPLLNELGLLPGRSTVLSVGCGGAWDVESLHAAGYCAWGVDNGSRVLVWKDRITGDFLSLGDALQLPFSNDSFDLVFSEGVIEHIGCDGDSFSQRSQWHSERERFVQSLLRVARPGGYILVTCPNRLFPVDFFHGGKTLGNLHLRFHLPSETFLLSYADIERLFRPHADWLMPLSLRRFFNLGSLRGNSKLWGNLIDTFDSIAGILPRWFWRSILSPYLVVLVKKAAVNDVHLSGKALA